MKWKSFKMIASIILVLIASCDEPETTVTNYVHTDGSVTRKIEMKSSKRNFEISNVQVPYDSTWNVQDSLEFEENGDTIWIRRAEKLYSTIEEINNDYRADSGANKDVSRRVALTKKFRWFNTIYRFSENIDKELEGGYPIGNFLTNEELLIFYSPDRIKAEQQFGPDSLQYRIINDTITKKVDRWMMKCLVSEWIEEFTNLIKENGDTEITKEKLKKYEDQFVKLLEADDDMFDSLWVNSILLIEFTGEADALKYKTEADSAINIVTNKFIGNFKEYSVRVIMPGKLIGSNGYPDSSEVLLWPVKSDFFLTENYEMWAESKIVNSWTWIVSGLLLAFLITGLILKKKKG